MPNLSDYVASQFGGNEDNDLLIAGGVASVADTDTIAHGLSAAPTRYGASATAAGHIVAITAVSATTLTVSLVDDAGTPVAVAENVSWWAGL